MKSPHNQRPDNLAKAETEKFIARYTGLPKTTPKGTASRAKKTAAAANSSSSKRATSAKAKS